MKPKIKIEKGVKIPDKMVKWSVFPFADMEVGDSFFVKKNYFKHIYSLLQLKQFIWNKCKNFKIETDSISKFHYQIDRINNGVRVFKIE
jgi:hypothetical protein